MEERNMWGVNLKIEPLAEKLLAVASAEGATAHEFWLACEKAQRMVSEKSRQLLVGEIMDPPPALCATPSTSGEGLSEESLEQRIEKILETIVEDLSKDDVEYMEIQLKETHINALDMALKLSRRIHGKSDD